MGFQTIGYNKVNQLRHVRYFKNLDGVMAHMMKHAAVMRPKFETVERVLEQEIGGTGLGTWTSPGAATSSPLMLCRDVRKPLWQSARRRAW